MTTSQIQPAALVTARALLAWSQADLARAANVHVTEVTDFELGAREVSGSVVDEMTAALIAGGIVFDDPEPRLPPPPPKERGFRAGQPIRWIEASDLEDWANRRMGQDGLPELIARLVRAEHGLAATLRFPSGDSVAQPGWDGETTVASSYGKTPQGRAGWELGVDRDSSKGKADKEYRNRTKEPFDIVPAESSFVFVTPRRWSRKTAWVKARKAEGVWKDVVVYDADDLVHWIESHPAVAQWLAVKLGKRPLDVQALTDVWEEWSGATKASLSSELTRIGRDEDAAAMLRWLSGAPEPFFVQAESVEEAAAFTFATIDMLPTDYRRDLEVRMLVPMNVAAAEQLSDGLTPLILVLRDADIGFATRLAKKGHHVLVALGPDAVAPTSSRVLAKPTREQLQSALSRMGLSRREAETLSLDAGRSLAVLRRLMPPAPGRRPAWSEAAPDRALLIALLVGGWSGNVDGDCAVIERLSGRSHDEVVRALAAYATTMDAPLRHSDGTWRLRSPRDAWTLLARFLTAADVAAFLDAYRDVCAEVDPTWAMPPDQRWLASIHNIRQVHTDLLRQSMTDTLTLLSVHGARALLVSRPKALVDQTVATVLDNASDAGWWSLAGLLRKLAEASPDAFLAALDLGLRKTPSPLEAFFELETRDYSRTRLPELMWALERLAWDPVLLQPVAETLARLNALDGGGQNVARPKGVLRTIFLSWSPQTNASLQQRLAVVDALRRRHGDVAWDLMLSIPPRAHAITFPTSSAQWRDVADDAREPVTDTSLKDCVVEISNRLIEDVGLDPGRWAQILKTMEILMPEALAEIGRTLLAAEPSIIDDRDREQIRTAIRLQLNRHLEFQSAPWAIPEAELRVFQTALEQFEPADPLLRHGWRFSNGTGWARSADWNAMMKEAEVARATAFEEIIAAHGADGIEALLAVSDHPRWIGEAMARSPAAEAWRAGFVQRGLAAEDGALWETASAIIELEMADAGPEVITRLLPKQGGGDLDHRATQRLLTFLKGGPDVWALAASYGEAFDAHFWRTIPTWRINGAKPDLERAVGRLVEADRARDAVHVIGRKLDMSLDSGLIVATLKAALASQPTDIDDNEPHQFVHHLARILDHLENVDTVSSETLVELEWYYFEGLKHSERPAPAVQRELARNPTFFVQVLGLAFGNAPVGDGPAPTEAQRRVLAERAYDVLEAWHQAPEVDEAGGFGGWIDTTRRLSEAARLLDVADSRIGRMLGRRPKTPDTPWPPENVRAVLERIDAETLHDGFVCGARESRGVVTRSLREGGVKERTLSTRYRQDADAIAATSPVTASLLRQIADSYDYRAESEDQALEERHWS